MAKRRKKGKGRRRRLRKNKQTEGSVAKRPKWRKRFAKVKPVGGHGPISGEQADYVAPGLFDGAGEGGDDSEAEARDPPWAIARVFFLVNLACVIVGTELRPLFPFAVGYTNNNWADHRTEYCPGFIPSFSKDPPKCWIEQDGPTITMNGNLVRTVYRPTALSLPPPHRSDPVTRLSQRAASS